MSKTKNVLACLVGVVVLALAAFFGAHAVGVWNVETQTREHLGGEWTTGANSGRAWSQFQHPSEWHQALVKGKEEIVSECVAPGKIANASTAQPLFGKPSFEARLCNP